MKIPSNLFLLSIFAIGFSTIAQADIVVKGGFLASINPEDGNMTWVKQSEQYVKETDISLRSAR